MEGPRGEVATITSSEISLTRPRDREGLGGTEVASRVKKAGWSTVNPKIVTGA